MNRTTNPSLAAKELLYELGWSKPGDLSLEEMVYAKGASVRDAPMKGCEGRILVKGQSSIIRVNSEITHPGKRNFVIAHELGHFLMHKNIARLFSDTNKTLSDWYKNGPHEQEANVFAVELLMPAQLFKDKVKGKKLAISLIEDVSQYFGVSLTSAFLRYARLGDFPLMVVFIEKGIIEWKQASEDFPFQYLPLKIKVPPLTVAGDFFNGNGLEERPAKVDVIEWFPEDFEAQKKSTWQVWEQCFQVSKHGLISCLWTF